jgi:hypothetical protein
VAERRVRMELVHGSNGERFRQLVPAHPQPPYTEKERRALTERARTRSHSELYWDTVWFWRNYRG